MVLEKKKKKGYRNNDCFFVQLFIHNIMNKEKMLVDSKRHPRLTGKFPRDVPNKVSTYVTKININRQLQ